MYQAQGRCLSRQRREKPHADAGGTQHVRSRLSHGPDDIPSSSALPTTPAPYKVSFAEPERAGRAVAEEPPKAAAACVPHHVLALPFSLQIAMPGKAHRSTQQS